MWGRRGRERGGGGGGGGGAIRAEERVECEVVQPLPDELRDAERDAKQLTYTQRVELAFVAFITFYSKLHQGHGVKASSLDKKARRELAEEGVKLSIEMQRAFTTAADSYQIGYLR